MKIFRRFQAQRGFTVVFAVTVAAAILITFGAIVQYMKVDFMHSKLTIYIVLKNTSRKPGPIEPSLFWPRPNWTCWTPM